MLSYPNDKYIKDDVPSNIQGAGHLDAMHVVLPLGNQHEGKRMVSAEVVQAFNAHSPQKPKEKEESEEYRDAIDLGTVRETAEEEPHDKT